MGRIIESYPNDKGEVQRVDVKTNSKEAVHRATSCLVPLYLEADEEEPALRRSKRPHNHTTTLLTRVVSCWLFLMAPATNASRIRTLMPGVAIEALGPSRSKAFDLDFTTITKLNITSDLASIESNLQEFQSFCLQYQQSKYPRSPNAADSY